MMLETFILFFAVATSGHRSDAGISMVTQEFHGKVACVEAGKALQAQAKAQTGYVYVNKCVPKKAE